MAAARGDHQQERTALLISPAKHGPEPAGALRAAQDSADFDVRWKPFVHGADRSGRVALIGSQQNRRQRIPAARAAHLLQGRALANHTADGGKRPQMLGPRFGR